MAISAAAFKVVKKHNRRASVRRPAMVFVDLDHVLLAGRHGRTAWGTLGRATRDGALVAYTEHRYTDALRELSQLGGPAPTAIIGEGGATLHIGPELADDQAWRDHVMAGWEPVEIAHRVELLPGLEIDSAAHDISLWSVRVTRTGGGPRLTAPQISNFLRDRGCKATAHHWGRDEVLITPMYADPVGAADYFTLCCGISAHDVLAVTPALTARAWRGVASRIVAVSGTGCVAPAADGQITPTTAQGAAGALEGLEKLGLTPSLLAA